MAFFSNSDEGLAFAARYCVHCAHHDEDRGCPVMLAHMLHQGEAAAAAVLDLLIPREDGEARCAMYIEAPGGVPWD